MGITTKIWPASDAQIARCLAEPAHVDHLFWRCDDHAKLHDSRAFEALLRELATRADLVREVPRAKEPSFVVASDAVARLREDEAHRALFAFRSICVNDVQLDELVARAIANGHGLVFCSYEDW